MGAPFHGSGQVAHSYKTLIYAICITSIIPSLHDNLSRTSHQNSCTHRIYLHFEPTSRTNTSKVPTLTMTEPSNVPIDSITYTHKDVECVFLDRLLGRMTPLSALAVPAPQQQVARDSSRRTTSHDPRKPCSHRCDAFPTLQPIRNARR